MANIDSSEELASLEERVVQLRNMIPLRFKEPGDHHLHFELARVRKDVSRDMRAKITEENVIARGRVWLRPRHVGELAEQFVATNGTLLDLEAILAPRNYGGPSQYMHIASLYWTQRTVMRVGFSVDVIFVEEVQPAGEHEHILKRVAIATYVLPYSDKTYEMVEIALWERALELVALTLREFETDSQRFVHERQTRILTA
ncbi:MAG: hypothetical protein Q8O98_01465 [bacterium]|nr:hypothetical protein [bacterium]